MDVVISGSRGIKDSNVVNELLDQTLPKGSLTVIVGGAGGIDQLALEYCIQNHIDVEVCFAQWDELGRKAGMVRNIEMLNRLNDSEDEVVVIWDGNSPGAKHTFSESLKRNIDTTLIITGDKYVE